ncbi:MAG: S-adenosylmethionine:tRNA ribosyltransferase-isomerase [Luteibaculaceae bacterium]
MDYLDINQFNYDLPDSRIAKYPLEERDASQLLTYKNDTIAHTSFINLAEQLPENALLLFNETKVVNARFKMQKPSGGVIEVFCLNPMPQVDVNVGLASKGSVQWQCMVGGLKKWKEGEIQLLHDELKLYAKLVDKSEEAIVIEFRWEPSSLSFAEVLSKAGELPLPPYLNRIAEEEDYQRYQTIFAKYQGSVAAPTASLHFTPRVLKRIQEKGIKTGFLTLHVGAGTFKPVSTENALAHDMHPESFVLSKAFIDLVAAHDGPIIPVGTTALRTIESLYWMALESVNNNQIVSFLEQNKCYEREQEHLPDFNTVLTAFSKLLQNAGQEFYMGDTQIMIRPGYQWKITKGLITNFHQPKSTLLLLISALVGNRWNEIYNYALKNDFRFLSYGDSSLLIP